MSDKVLLILVDGMRPDSIPACGNPDFEAFYRSGTHCLNSATTYPPVTLPCHMSMFHSVDPERHGVYSNDFVKQNHPIDGLVEVLAKAGKTTAFFYMWEGLRDLCTPRNHLSYSWYMSWHYYKEKQLDWRATRAAEEHIRELAPDFVFLYLGETDEIGHKYGWMSPEYLNAVKTASECIDHICHMLPEAYSVIVTADHGGHGRNHGDDIPEDMTIPIVFHSAKLAPGAVDGINIKDIAPTIAAIIGVQPGAEWEGVSLLKR